MNLRRRLQALEKGLMGAEPIVLHMPDGRTETIPSRGDYNAEPVYARLQWRADAGDGADRGKHQRYRAGRRTYERTGAGAFELPIQK